MKKSENEVKLKISKNRTNKIHLVFDENKRKEFLTGFHKRKLQRKKQAQENLKKELKEERKRLKAEAKESYKNLVVSHRPIPELETLLKEEYEDGDVNIQVVQLSTNDIAQKKHWIGANQPKYENVMESENETLDDSNDNVPGMEIKPKTIAKEKVQQKLYSSEKEVKRMLKKEATRKVQKSKVFKQKNKIERTKQKKKSMHIKNQRTKIREKKNNTKKHN